MFVCLNIGYQRNSFFKENFWHKKAKVYNENKKSISLKNWKLEWYKLKLNMIWIRDSWLKTLQEICNYSTTPSQQLIGAGGTTE